MSTSADRAAAVRALLRTERGAFASRLLGRAAPGVRARVLEVLRWQRRIDETLAGQLDRPLDRLDPEVRAVLRLGLAEAETMGVPPAVAVDGAVHLVRRLGKGSAAGLVNAVLRRAVRSWDALDRDGGPPDLVLSHPAWLWRRWLARFGLEAVASMRADQTPAPVWAWWLDEDALEELKGQNAWVKPHPWCPGAWTAPGPVLPREAAAGRAYIQDPASQLAAHLAASFAGGERATLAALCAAPGGKVALAARHARWARLVAGDLHPGRARHLAFLLGRVTDAPVAVWDAARPPLLPASWTVVLLDAPCSGTGTLRRHPELKWRLDEDAIRERAALQARLIRAALPLVAPGGVLLYTTCSVEPEENEELFRDLPGGFDPVELDRRVFGAPVLSTPAGGVRLLPGPDWDGFTFHAVRRIARG